MKMLPGQRRSLGNTEDTSAFQEALAKKSSTPALDKKALDKKTLEKQLHESQSRHRAVQPPSTSSETPVANDDWSDSRNMTAATTSSTWPSRPTGRIAASWFLRSPATPTNRSTIGVAMKGGATAFTRTPRPASSNAAVLVNPSTACLLAL